MDFFQVIEQRHSIRKFSDAPVEEEKYRQILDAINKAPSAGNLQGYEVYVVRGKEQLRELVRAAGGQKYLAEAPLTLVFCANPARSGARYRQRGEKLYSVQDATIACTFAMLALAALGLATVWIGAFDDESVRKVLGISSDLVPVAMLPVGYAAEEPRHTPRRKLADLIHEL